MEKFQPNFNITNEILSYVSSISEKLGMVSSAGNLENRPVLKENNRVLSVYAALHLDGNSLKYDQMRDILKGNNASGDLREIMEVQNYAAAYDNLSMIDPCSLQQFKMIHAVAERYLLTDAGEFRHGLDPLIREFFAWLTDAAESLHPLVLAALVHYEIAQLHPFSEGNEKMARLWQKAVLIQWKSVFRYVPIESRIEKERDSFAAVLKNCREHDDITSFIVLMLKMIDQSLENLTEKISEQPAEVSESIGKLLSVMEYGQSYTGSVLMELMHLKSRESFREHYLRPALDQNLIVMTIPDKPNSRNQRYRKV